VSKRFDFDTLDHYVFNNSALLTQALTHRSASSLHNQRLEFLGDSVLNLLIAQMLYQRWPQADEGALTRARSAMVCESALAAIARQLNLGQRLILGAGEIKSGGQYRDSILADALEAVIAAIYLDSGLKTCQKHVLPWFENVLETLSSGKANKDAKTRLQEWLQARHKPLPHYQLINEMGAEHARQFSVQCQLVDPLLMAQGQGHSRRLAEQQAAQALLMQLDNNDE